MKNRKPKTIFPPPPLCLFLLALVHTSAPGSSQPVEFKSDERQTALIELYTSEGCSSCPPAETWLSRLKTSSGLWKDFVPMAFHVEYWDYLGWRDAWATVEFSGRQRAYARSWQSRRIYTPGFVLNGKEWRDWSGFKDGQRPAGAAAGVLKVSSTDLSHWQVNFAPASSGDGGYEVHAALLASDLSSDVKAGENKGHRLTHDFVVTGLVKAPMTTTGGKAQGEVILNQSAKDKPARPAIAVWVTRAGSLEPLQATGGWLPKPGGRS